MKGVLESTGFTWGAWYWPVWLVVVLVSFLGPEIFSLCTDHGPNTLSGWVWRALKIHAAESPLQWSATDFLAFGVWATLMVWLSFHFFTGRFV